MELIERLKNWFHFEHSEEPQETAVREVTVHKGDSLSAIAQDVTGDASRWRELANANRDKAWGADYVVHPGDKLKLPESWR